MDNVDMSRARYSDRHYDRHYVFPRGIGKRERYVNGKKREGWEVAKDSHRL